MERKITEVVYHMAKSHRELARILEIKRDVTAHAARLTTGIPNEVPVHPEAGHKETADQALSMNKNLVAYLTALADLEDALSDNLGLIMKELNADGEE